MTNPQKAYDQAHTKIRNTKNSESLNRRSAAADKAISKAESDKNADLHKRGNRK
jgi:hypothetical protein